MESNGHSHNGLGRLGFGLVEVIAAISVLAIVATTFFYISTAQRQSAVRLSSATDCTTLTAGITSQIKAYDNALIVRNWLPTSGTDFNILMPAIDPFCNRKDGRTPVCDPFPIVKNHNNGLIDLSDVRTHLNIRGAFTFVQSLYNRSGAAICSESGGQPEGMRLTAAELGNLIPGRVELPDWPDHYRLYIREMSTACGTTTSDPNGKFYVQVGAVYRTNPTGDLTRCVSALTITPQIDSRKPELQITRVYNNLNTIEPGRCTDTRLVENINGNPGTEWQNVYFDYRLNEPGALILSRKDAAWDRTQANQFYNVPEMPLTGGSASVSPAEISYNKPFTGTISLRGQVDRRGLEQYATSLYGYSFTAIDTSRNLATVTAPYTFMVTSPTCPPSDTYCPDASPATPSDTAVCAACVPGVPNPNPACTDCWNTQGDKNRRPYDNCMNGLCPNGTRTRQGCGNQDASLICAGTFYQDDCGNLTCPGQLQPSCPPGPYTAFPCGTVVPGTCDDDCGTGTGINLAGLDRTTVDCDCIVRDSCNNDTGLRGIGGTNGAIVCPGPPSPTLGQHRPNCDCTGIDYSTIPCGESVDDICVAPATAADVTPQSCGRGTMGCSACAPTPTAAPVVCNEAPTSGSWSCSDHKWIGDTTCRLPPNPTTIVANPTCSTYTMRITFVGHRHGGSSLRVALSFVGRAIPRGLGGLGGGAAPVGGYNNVKIDERIDAFSWPGWHHANRVLTGFPAATITYRATPGVPVRITGLIYDIHDGEIVVNWTVTPSTP